MSDLQAFMLFMAFAVTAFLVFCWLILKVGNDE